MLHHKSERSRVGTIDEERRRRHYAIHSSKSKGGSQRMAHGAERVGD